MVHIVRGRLEIYLNSDKLNAKQVRKKTGATAVINGGVFDLKTWELYCHVKKDGVVLASDPYDYWGYGWSGDGVPKLMSAHNAEDNYFCCCCMIYEGKTEQMIYNADMGGARERTAIGVYPDGRIWMYAGKASMTPQALQAFAMSYGLDSAIMLDGGASTQISCPDGDVIGGRIAAYYILLFEDTGAKPEKEDKMKIYLSPSSQTANSYAAGKTNEAEQCMKIATACKTALERCGFEVKVGAADLDYKGRTDDSNAWGADIHVPIHTNAAGGSSGTAHGPALFVYGLNEARTKLAQPVYDALLSITPYKGSFGVQVGRMYEILYANAKTVYIEAAFHDNADDAAWIVAHTTEIGEAIAKGLCEGTGATYVEPVKTNWFDSIMRWGKTMGICDGTRGGEAATRAEVVQMIYNYHRAFAPEDDKTVSGLLEE